MEGAYEIESSQQGDLYKLKSKFRAVDKNFVDILHYASIKEKMLDKKF